MANGGTIKYKVGFDVDSSGLQALKTALADIQKMTRSDLMKIHPQLDGRQITEMLTSIRHDAAQVEDALRKAFNPKLNTINIQEFERNLSGVNGGVKGLYERFSQAGAVGQNAFRSVAAQLTTTNSQLRQTKTLVDKMATTLGNTIKWTVSSAAVNSFSNSIQQAYGYVKSLDSSLNDIRIVTNKSAEQMGHFAMQANEAAKAMGATTMDYTKAALTFYQQGLNDQEVRVRTEAVLKAQNITGAGKEMADYLKKNGLFSNNQDADLLFIRLDKSRKGNIGFPEIEDEIQTLY